MISKNLRKILVMKLWPGIILAGSYRLLLSMDYAHNLEMTGGVDRREHGGECDSNVNPAACNGERKAFNREIGLLGKEDLVLAS